MAKTSSTLREGLTKEQSDAVLSDEKSMVVSAAAGSGKTRVLVERYLWQVLEHGFQPDQILAITFTRKAAAEMKRRIVDQLTALKLYNQAQIAETGPIQTIHGFCERLLRENAIEAAIDPEFEILSEAQSARFLEESIREVLANPPEGCIEAAALVRKLAGRRAFGDSVSPHARLEGAIREAVHGWRGTNVSRTYLRESHLSPVALLSEWRARLLEGTPPEVLAAMDSQPAQGNLATRLVNAYRVVKKQKPRYIRPSIEADLECAEQTCGLMQLALAAWARYEGKMRDRQSLDFAALEEHARELLMISPAAKSRLREQYPIVLIDESQDLNPVQYQLLELLDPQSEMFVGDPQQSIYGFRQADSRLFEKKRSSSYTNRLSTNHRSAPGILGFVDKLFGALWPGYEPMLPQASVHYPGVEIWIQRQKHVAGAAEWIAELVAEWGKEGRKANEIAILVRQSGYAMQLLRELKTVGVKARVSGGTEQFYARLEVRDVANVLEALTDPKDDFALAAVLRSPFVGLTLDTLVELAGHKPILSALKLVRDIGKENPEDLNKIVSFLRWFEPLSQFADRLSAVEVMAEVFAKSPYWENLARRENGRQQLANVRKLVLLAAQEPESAPREYAERIRQIQAIRHKEGDAPAGDQDDDEVTIMTIHKSKGLEFPVVVVPDTHKKLARNMKDVEIDPELRLITTRFGRTASMFHDWLASNRQDREKEEEWRVMYVALTRAKERLCVVANPGGAGGRIADDMCKLLGYKKEPLQGVAIRGGVES